MDDKGNLHVIEGSEEEQEAEALRRGLVRVPPEEAKAVGAMAPAERRAWLARRLATDSSKLTRAARQRLRNKRKAQRRARRRGR